MKHRSPARRLGAALGCLAIAGALLAPIASAETTTTLNLKEPHKGGTEVFVDNNPTTTFKRGIPKKVSAGDQLIFTSKVTEGGNEVGNLRAVCTATKATKNLGNEIFQCEGTYTLKGGALIASALLKFSPKPTLGAITGGTGKYAGARGTFETKEGKSGNTLTIIITQ